MSKWNGKRFSVYTSDEKSALGLIKELGEQTNFNTEETERLQAEKLDLDPMVVHDLRTISLPTYSLDFIVSEDKETNAVDLIPDTNCVDPEEFANNESRRAGIIRILETLPPRDKEILTKRYGLITGIPATLDEIGQDLHLTRERVRQ